MNKSIMSQQGLRKIEYFKNAEMHEYIGASTIARALGMSLNTFRNLASRAGIDGLQNGKNTLYKKEEVVNLRDKARISA